MKVFLRILLCTLLTTSTECKTNLLKDITGFVYNVLTLGLDLSDRLQSNDVLEKVQESINKLQRGIERVHSMLEYTKKLLEAAFRLIKVKSYFDSFNHHIEKIDSCITDLQYVFKDPTDIVARENFQKCYNIMTDVRALGRYLCGNPMIGSKPLFDSFHNEDGSCKGEDIEMIFRALYAKFIDGCILTSTAERMKHNNSSTLYRDECLGMNKNITDYMTNFYGKCIKLSCSSFHARVSTLLKNLEKVDTSTIYSVLQRNYPWLQFNVIEVWREDALVENNGTFYLNSGIFVVKNKVFLVFCTDVFVKFSKHRAIENQKYVNITVSYRDFESWFLGMNLSYENPLETKRINALGYTSHQTIDTCKYLPGTGDSSLVTPNSGNHLRIHTFMFVAVILLELLKSLYFYRH